MLASIAIAGFVYYLVAVAALHFLRPELDPVKQHISQYAIGPYGWTLTSALYALGLASVALAVGLRQSLSPSGMGRAGVILLALFGVSIVVVGIFPTNAEGAPSTTSGLVHSFAFVLACFCLIPALILLPLQFRQDDRWRSFTLPSMTLALLVLATFIGFIAASGTEITGLSQRVFVGSFMVWLLTAAVRLRYI